MSFSIRNFFRRDATKPSPAPGGDRRLTQQLVDRGIAAENSGAAGEALECYRQAIAAFARNVADFESEPVGGESKPTGGESKPSGGAALRSATAHAFMAWSLAYLGEFAEASTHAREAERLAEEDGEPWSIEEASYVAFAGKRTVAPAIKPGAADSAAVLADVRERAFEILDGVAAGVFPVRPHDITTCRHCSYAAVCRKDYVGDE